LRFAPEPGGTGQEAEIETDFRPIRFDFRSEGRERWSGLQTSKTEFHCLRRILNRKAKTIKLLRRILKQKAKIFGQVSNV
jgi:hypothetical protein